MAVVTDPVSLRSKVEQIAAGAAERDRFAGIPPFPDDAFAVLGEAGMLAPIAGLADQLEAVRAVARADGSVGRIFDGHVNAVERLGLTEFDGLLGVWGADPAPGEGEPARVDGDRMFGVKTFCSGSGGLDRVLVLIRGDLVHVDLASGATIDEDWYRSAGLRASASHRVVFDGAPVLGVVGPIGALPWFARDAVRTTATWAGLADAALDAALSILRAKEATDLVALAVGRMRTAHATIDLWMAEAARSEAPTPAFATHLRDAVAGCCRTLVDEAIRATGSRPLATGGALDRAKRDLDVFLLQHRLDPLVARAGRAELEA
ncbi:MAG: hypothetical protein WKF94_03955 [Solirubrobacteraceae bacterium]